jgi:hypothetical protein
VTTLRLVHSGFGAEAAFDEEYDGIRGGWPVELRSLRLYLEHHRGRDRRLAWAVRSTDDAPDAVWRGLAGAGALGAPQLAATPEGGRYRVDVPGAGAIEGVALFSPTAREFSGTADNLGHGWFRVHCERWGGATQVWLWLATYTEPAERTAAFARAFERLLDRAVPRPGEAAERSA